MVGVEERWKNHLMLNILEIRSFIFAQKVANKVLENQVKAKAFIGVAQLVQWHQNHGINLVKTMKIAITGGKGGTGKSTIATALAVELANKNKVLLIDADVDCPNDHLILSIKRKKVKDIFQIIPKWDFSKCVKCGKCATICKTNAIVFVKDKFPIFIENLCNGCSACIISCPEKAISKSYKKVGEIYSGKNYNINLISAQIIPNYPGSAFVVDKEKEFVKQKEKNYDSVLIDTAVGTHCNVVAAFRDVNLALAVTESTPLGQHDLELILKLLRILKIPVKVILNKSDIGNKKLIQNIVKKYKTEIIAEIPYRKEILEAYSKGKPIRDKNIIKIIKSIKK